MENLTTFDRVIVTDSSIKTLKAPLDASKGFPSKKKKSLAVNTARQSLNKSVSPRADGFYQVVQKFERYKQL